MFKISSCAVLFLLLVAVFTPVIIGLEQPTALTQALQPPSFTHPLGTDQLGRDEWRRVLLGTHYSLLLAVAVLVIVTCVGVSFGLLTAVSPSPMRRILTRIIDLVYAFPALLLALAIAGMLGGSVLHLVLALSLSGWAKYAKITLAASQQLSRGGFLTTARLTGASTPALLWRHLLPNLVPLLLTTCCLDLGVQLVEIAGLSFLGLGVPAPLPEWGTMISEGRRYLQVAPWLCFAPGGAIFLTSLLINWWGKAVARKFTPGATNALSH